MAAKKTAKKTAEKKTPVVTAPAKKVVAKAAPAKAIVAKPAPVKKAVAKKAPAKKAATNKSTATQYTSEQVYSMIEQAAYYAAVNDGFQRDSGTYWAKAEQEINAMIKG